MVECIKCGKDTYLTEEQAKTLDCEGVHFVRKDGQMLAVYRKGLKAGSYSLFTDVENGVNVEIGSYCKIHNTSIGDHTRIDNFVDICGATIGKNCRIMSHVVIPPGTVIGDNVCIRPGVIFSNEGIPKNHIVIKKDSEIHAGSVIRADEL